MDIKEYQPYWEAVVEPMTAKMTELVTLLRPALPAGLVLTEPEKDTLRDEFMLTSSINNANGDFIIGMDFCLLDGDIQGGEGLGICLSITGYGGLAMGGYYPDNYTDNAFTLDVDALVRKVTSLDVSNLAGYILESALKNQYLVEELAKAGLSMFQVGSSQGQE